LESNGLENKKEMKVVVIAKVNWWEQ